MRSEPMRRLTGLTPVLLLAACELEDSRMHPVGDGVYIPRQDRLCVNEEVGQNRSVFPDRNGQMTGCFSNFIRDSGHLRHVGDIAVLVPEHEDHP